MTKINAKAKDFRVDRSHRTAGGSGVFAAKQDAETLLRRAVMNCLLWENNFYSTGSDTAEHIKALIPQVEPRAVAEIALDARLKSKLRHAPLFIVREMARLQTHKHLVASTLAGVVTRADQLSDFLALYWKEGKQPLSAQVKRGLALAFAKFNEYQLAKYRGDGNSVKLRDVMFLAHPSPADGNGSTRAQRKSGQVDSQLFHKLANNTLETPDTWEVALSGGKDKKATWERLISENKLGGLAFLRNLRNMQDAGVAQKVIRTGLSKMKAGMLLPLNFIAAARYAPDYEREIESAMLRSFATMPKLPGYTLFVVDMSGSMNGKISGKSEMSRLDSAFALAMLAAEMCESVAFYATAGNDSAHKHATVKCAPRRGFGLIAELKSKSGQIGGGGIFTRQCLEFIKSQEKETPERIIIFSDSQDCDVPGSKIPAPFGKKNYIVDVSSEKYGVNYEGVWTAEVAGWSEHFLHYIAALEGAAFREESEQ